jgi:hypothetical protein
MLLLGGTVYQMCQKYMAKECICNRPNGSVLMVYGVFTQLMTTNTFTCDVINILVEIDEGSY